MLRHQHWTLPIAPAVSPLRLNLRLTCIIQWPDRRS